MVTGLSSLRAEGSGTSVQRLPGAQSPAGGVGTPALSDYAAF